MQTVKDTVKMYAIREKGKNIPQLGTVTYFLDILEKEVLNSPQLEIVTVEIKPLDNVTKI